MPQVRNYDLLTDLRTRVKPRDASASKNEGGHGEEVKSESPDRW